MESLLLAGMIYSGHGILKLRVQPGKDCQISLLLLGQFTEILHLKIPQPTLLLLQICGSSLKLLVQKVSRPRGLLFPGLLSILG